MMITLRRAAPADIPFLMAAERGPGFEDLVGRSEAHVYAAALADPSMCVLVGIAEGRDLGFVWMTGIGDPHSGVCLKRIVAAEPGRGAGKRMVRAVLGWIFGEAQSPRAWLDALIHNERAIHVYEACGFEREGTMRSSYAMPDGTRTDRVLMAITRENWLARADSP
jgi:RimJ/RimL family protein N-acetyltransferase